MSAEHHAIPENSIFSAGTSRITLEQLVDEAPVLIWVSDTQRRHVYFSKEWYRYTGQSPETALGRGWIEAVHPDDRVAAVHAFDLATNDRTAVKHVYRLRSKSEDYRWMLDRARPFYDDQGIFIGHIGSITDIHNRKIAEEKATENERRYQLSEEKLEVLMRDLEDRVEKRTLELKQANSELIRANNDLEQYAYIASHDLQEPLRKIRFFADLLSQRPGDTERFYFYLSKIQASASRMSTLIHDVLNYSTLSKNTRASADVDLNDIAREVLKSFEDEISNKNATVTVGPLPILQGVPSNFLLLFNNLLGNSLTFSERPPAIEITSKEVDGKDKASLGADPDRRYVQIDFKDNGIGFDQAYGDRIFEVFERLHDKGSHTGNGMGLPLCKKIVENHNGFIAARSAVGHGSTFEIYLPLPDR